MKMDSFPGRTYLPARDLAGQRPQPAAHPARADGWASLVRQSRRALRAVSARLRSPRVMLAVQLALILLCLIPIGRLAAQDWSAVSQMVR